MIYGGFEYKAIQPNTSSKKKIIWESNEKKLAFYFLKGFYNSHTLLKIGIDIRNINSFLNF